MQKCPSNLRIQSKGLHNDCKSLLCKYMLTVVADEDGIMATAVEAVTIVENFCNDIKNMDELDQFVMYKSLAINYKDFLDF